MYRHKKTPDAATPRADKKLPLSVYHINMNFSRKEKFVESLRIDPEFKDKIPALTEDEYRQLEENILTAGEVYTPIITWDGIIVDGHNRWKIIQAHPEKNIVYRTMEIPFKDKWEAFDWIYKNQLGRRNLTDEQRRYLLGKLYEARKHHVGGHVGNQYTKVELVQNAPVPTDARDGVAGIIAKEQGVNQSTVKRAEKFAKGIEAIKEVAPEFASDILAGKKKEIPMSFVRQIGSASKEHQSSLIEHIINNTPLKPGRPKKDSDEKPFPKKIIQGTKRGDQILDEIHEVSRRHEEGIVTEKTLAILCQNWKYDVQSMIDLLDTILEEPLATKEIVSRTRSAINALITLKEVFERERS